MIRNITCSYGIITIIIFTGSFLLQLRMPFWDWPVRRAHSPEPRYRSSGYRVSLHTALERCSTGCRPPAGEEKQLWVTTKWHFSFASACMLGGQVLVILATPVHSAMSISDTASVELHVCDSALHCNGLLHISVTNAYHQWAWVSTHWRLRWYAIYYSLESHK